MTRSITIAMLLALFSILFCTPTQAHQGMPNIDAREVCIEQALGDACEWSDSHSARYIGSCRLVSESLLCVRNKPIVYLNDHEKH